MAQTVVSSHSHTSPCVTLSLIFSHALRMRRCAVDTMISWRSFALVCFNRDLWSIQAYKTFKTSNIIGGVSVLLTPWLMSFSDLFPLLYCAVDGLWTPIIFGLKFGFCTTCTYFAWWPREKKNYKSHCTNEPLRKTVIKTNKLFIVAMGDVAPASEKSETPYDVRGYSKEVDLVPKYEGVLYWAQ